MRLLSSLLGVIIVFLALAFALANRQSATISFWPFGMKAQAPLCFLTLGTFFFGLLLGAILTWISSLPNRLATRHLRRDLASLQNKMDELKQTVLPPQTDKTVSLLPRPRAKWSFRRSP